VHRIKRAVGPFTRISLLQAIPNLKPGQLVSSCPGLMSITRKVTHLCQGYLAQKVVGE